MYCPETDFKHFGGISTYSDHFLAAFPGIYCLTLPHGIQWGSGQCIQTFGLYTQPQKKRTTRNNKHTFFLISFLGKTACAQLIVDKKTV